MIFNTVFIGDGDFVGNGGGSEAPGAIVAAGLTLDDGASALRLEM